MILSHYNIASNIAATMQVLGVAAGEGVLGILPFSHAFGYMATLWLAPSHGIAVIYHRSPLDASTIGKLVQRYKVTVLVATPPFHPNRRRYEPEQFGSLRMVVAGAEKLPDWLADAFTDRFGIRPLEGYGATQCSPVIAVNVPGFRQARIYQSGGRRGTVGHPLPGSRCGSWIQRQSSRFLQDILAWGWSRGRM